MELDKKLPPGGQRNPNLQPRLGHPHQLALRLDEELESKTSQVRGRFFENSILGPML
jgi:hypothetical protein